MSYVIIEGKRYYKDDGTGKVSLDTATQEEADRREQRNNYYSVYVDNTNYRKRIVLVLFIFILVIFGIAKFYNAHHEAKTRRAISQYMALHEESNSDTGTINSEVESQTENNHNGIVKTNDYIMPDSASRYLELSDIETLDDDDLQMIIYEIIARHGHEFILQKNMDYFKTKAWYTPIPGKTDREIYSEFNEYERANMTFLKQQLKERKV